MLLGHTFVFGDISLRRKPKNLNNLNGEMATILIYFTEFGSGPYFALFHRIRCRRKTIVTLTSVSKSTFDI